MFQEGIGCDFIFQDGMEPVLINVSDVIEYNFCPRFIYYIYCLKIPQHEEKRYKVIKGRAVHEDKSRINKKYLRKKLGVLDKRENVYLSSRGYKIKGIVDEVLFLEDGNAAPLDYKFAEYKERLFKTHRFQSVLYGLMIKEVFDVEVKKGFVCYVRSNNLVKEIIFRSKDFEKGISAIDEILEIIWKGTYPDGRKNLNKCVDCAYRRICV